MLGGIRSDRRDRIAVSGSTGRRVDPQGRGSTRMHRSKRPSLATTIKPRAVWLAVASCLAAALISAPAASAAIGNAEFGPVPSVVPRNTPVTITLTHDQPGRHRRQQRRAGGPRRPGTGRRDQTRRVTVQGYECPDGTKLTTLPTGTPAGTVACHWDTLAADSQVELTVTILPADDSWVSLTGYQSVGGVAPAEVDLGLHAGRAPGAPQGRPQRADQRPGAARRGRDRPAQDHAQQRFR